MASVFLSYDHDDSAMAASIASALEKAGHSVWWDRHIHGGAEYNSEIESAVQSADAVVVLWSERSVRSAWVRDEAAEGRDRGTLVPLLIDPVKPPMGFRQYQTIDFTGWRRGRSAKLNELLGAVAAVGKSTAAASPLPQPVMAKRWRPPRSALIAAAVAAVLLIVGLGAWRLLTPPASIPTVAVAAAETSPLSQTLARDLLSKLGSLQSAQSDSMKLAAEGEGAGRNADLVFEVAGTNSGQQAEANIVLLGGKDRGVLWSREFQQPVSKLPDLKQQLAFSAAGVLRCALESLAPGGLRLEPETLKLYLTGCATIAEDDREEISKVVPMFREVIEKAPRFEGAWAKLLEAQNYQVLALNNDDVRKKLLADLEGARKVNPDLAQAYQLEIDLLPFNAYAQRIRLADRAVERNPNDPVAFSARSRQLELVGRTADAVTDARKAMELDPIAPALRVAYVYALAHAGEFQAALKELDEAERLWPGASNLAGQRFALNLRYGDPKEALRYIDSGQAGIGWADGRSYLEARADPTPAKVAAALGDALRFYREYPYIIHHVAQAHGSFNREKELLNLLLKVPLKDAIFTADVMYRPMLAEFWRDPRSLLYAKRIGLLGYWQSSGKWPDFCFKPNLPYDCKKEAAKLLA